MRRTYENALKLLETRRRSARPKGPESTTLAQQDKPPTTNQQSLRGVPSLVGMKEWLQALGHSDREINGLNIIHVSGTKGKGSTCAFTRGLLHAHSVRTGFPKRIGLYTGPHLQCIRERIQIGNRPVSEYLFTRYFFEVWDCVMPQDVERQNIEQGFRIIRQPRYLQFLALLAFHTFMREEVDAAIFEVHHGGEYDATNVIENPVVTGITALGLDHIAQLGPTIEDIAWHKSGIFKASAPAFSLNQEPGCAEVMQKRADDKGTTLRFVPTSDRLPESSVLKVPVQRLNCSLALELATAFLQKRAPGHTISDDDIYHGAESFSLAGRFEIIDEEKLRWFVDGAHNTLSVEQTAEWFAKNTNIQQEPNNDSDQKVLSSIFGSCRVLIFSQLSEDRDGEALVRSLAQSLFKHDVRPQHVIFTTYQEKDDDSNTLPSTVHKLCALYLKTWKELDPQATVTSITTIEGAIQLARETGTRENGAQVLITGSLHLVGGALGFLRP